MENEENSVNLLLLISLTYTNILLYSCINMTTLTSTEQQLLALTLQAAHSF